MDRGHIAFQVTGSLFAIFCAVSLAIVLGGCSATAVDWRSGRLIAGNPAELLRSDFRTFASLSGVVIPLSRTEEDAIIARAIAEHEMRNQ
jgi:hypothetical protein